MVACTLYHVHIHIVHKVSHLRHVLNNMYLVSWSFSILRKGEKSWHSANKAKQPPFKGYLTILEVKSPEKLNKAFQKKDQGKSCNWVLGACRHPFSKLQKAEQICCFVSSFSILLCALCLDPQYKPFPEDLVHYYKSGFCTYEPSSAAKLSWYWNQF